MTSLLEEKEESEAGKRKKRRNLPVDTFQKKEEQSWRERTRKLR